MTRPTRICVVLGSGITLLGLIVGGLVGYFEAGNNSDRVAIKASQISFLVSLVAFACTLSLIVISSFRCARTPSAPITEKVESSPKIAKRQKTLVRNLAAITAVLTIAPVLIAFLCYLLGIMFGLESPQPGGLGLFHTSGQLSLVLNMAIFFGIFGSICISPICFVLTLIFSLIHLASKN